MTRVCDNDEVGILSLFKRVQRLSKLHYVSLLEHEMI